MNVMVEKFLANVEEWNLAYFLEFMLGIGESRTRLNSRIKFSETETGKTALKELSVLREEFKIPEDSFKYFLKGDVLPILDAIELNALIDNMPSGWERAMLMTRLGEVL